LARRGFIGLVEKPDPVERGVDVADKGEELEVEGDLTLHLAELVGVARPHEAPVRVPAALAGAHEQVRPPERLLQLLHGRPRLRLPHRLRVLQPPEQRAYHLHPPRQLPAGGAVPAHRARRLGDHRDEAGGVEPHQLRHRGNLPDQSHLLAFGFALVSDFISPSKSVNAPIRGSMLKHPLFFSRPEIRAAPGDEVNHESIRSRIQFQSFRATAEERESHCESVILYRKYE